MIIDNKSDFAVKAKTDARKREQLIRQSEEDILKISSKACRKYVSKSDDEWSVALCAFSKAIDEYDKAKGNFMSFAAVLIKRDLIDYYRSEVRHSSEVLTSPEVFEGEADEEETAIEYAVIKESVNKADNNLKEEIMEITEKLKPFGFSFMDLTECSPKQLRSRKSCEKAIRIITEDRTLIDKMLDSKQLPASEITKRSGVSSKILDKFRKYIIASVIILSDEYPYVGWYLKSSERGQQT